MNKLIFVTVAMMKAAAVGDATAASVVDLTAPYPVYHAEVVRVIDGDTLVLKVNLWPGLTGSYSIRVRGIQAPEIKFAACEKEREWGLEAKETIEKLYDVGSAVLLENVEFDSFGRVLADVSRVRSDRRLYLSNELLERKLAFEWTPDKDDIHWCLLAETR